MKKGDKLTPFQRYWQGLSADESTALRDFFQELARHLALPEPDCAALRRDFEGALLYYAGQGLPLATALARLDTANLGGFYARPPILWYSLDDAAKIYPLSMKQGQMAVFRLSVTLNEPVVPELLQMALTFTIRRFPSFATTVKKGVFWHYLDTAKRRYALEPEGPIPCQPLAIAKSGSQSFRLQYYENRISVEYFHVLTDGSGGLVFLQTLTAEYFRLLGIEAPTGGAILDRNASPSPAETANEFSRAEKTAKAGGFVDKPALQLSGRLTRQRPCQIVHLQMNAKQLQELARRKQTTVTACLLGLLFLACQSAIDDDRGVVNIQVPVNMRKFYPSQTLRNFALYCGIKLPLAEIGSLDAILPEISSQLQAKASREAMAEMMNATEKLVRLVRYVPLAIKGPVAKVIYGFLGDRAFTTTLSNLGRVEFPAALASHIHSLDFVLGTALNNRAACSLVTWGQVATLSVAKTTADPSFEEALLGLLLAEGVETSVEGSELCEN